MIPFEAEPESCTLSRAPAPGPLAKEANAAREKPYDLALVRIREARLTSDPGFYELADLALQCALAKAPDDPKARSLHAHVLIQFHRFGEAEDLLAPLADETGDWRDRMLLGDALMEQGELDRALAAYDTALDLHPSLETYDRASNLAWLKGDLDRAIALEEQAYSAASAEDPEPAAWVATRLGWLKALAGKEPNEIGVALRALPDYRPARLLLGKFMLATGHTEQALANLEKAGPTIEAYRALAEIDPGHWKVEDVKDQDRRGWALHLAETDPAAAKALLDLELKDRHDAFTRVAHAWAVHRGGGDGADETRQALATGIAEPEALLLAAETLGDPALAARALARPVGLLPSERARAERVVGPEKNR